MPASTDVLVRRARPEDLPACGEITARAYLGVDLVAAPRGWAEPTLRAPARTRAWVERTRVALDSDPGGCWVAEVDGEVVGCVVSRVRESLWVLSSFAVVPGRQGTGTGARLLDAALAHGRDCERGMFISSPDPGAVRRYRLAGFDLHPTMVLHGEVDASGLTRPSAVREGADVEFMDDLDRRTRGAGHGVDHTALAAQFPVVRIDEAGRRGYAYLDTAGPALLAATDARTASDLLVESLARVPQGVPASVTNVTPANGWALDVGLGARLAVHSTRYLCLRGMTPPAPYLPHGSVL